jgi:gamma-glutamylcyclotransferase (GGCT)/AIG2-like uncharacterized protein YtfP
VENSVTEYLFLYGTLKPDAADREIAPIVRRLRNIGRGRVRGKLYDLGGYPGAVVDASANSFVRGLLVELPPDKATLEALDRYEEFDPLDPGNSLFVRTKTKVRLTDGRNLQGWIYVYNRDPGNAPLVRGGEYSKSKVA